MNQSDLSDYLIKNSHNLAEYTRNHAPEIFTDGLRELSRFYDHDQKNTNYLKQVHFALTVMRDGQPKRTTIMLESYLVKALQHKLGLINNGNIRV